ncbi:hypothetical protein JB92DRAFT_2153929 [Gautieria morchelliformis]|nr:hypothetical protein JB92DRAFT_2153929 [Gautieria morchelliformis]
MNVASPIMSFIGKMLDCKEDLLTFMWVLGTALLDPVVRSKGVLLYGPGGTGKSTLIKLVRQCLGECTTVVSSNALEGSRPLSDHVKIAACSNRIRLTWHSGSMPSVCRSREEGFRCPSCTLASVRCPLKKEKRKGGREGERDARVRDGLSHEGTFSLSMSNRAVFKSKTAAYDSDLVYNTLTSGNFLKFEFTPLDKT